MKAPDRLHPHAIDRFLERHYPEDAKPPREDAAFILDLIRATAVHIEDIPGENGQEAWCGRGAFRGVIMIVLDGEVKTVLKPGTTWRTGGRRAVTR